MRAKFTCRSVDANNHILRIHLTRDDYRDATSQPTEIFINALAESLTETFMRGDVWDVQLTLAERSGRNGPNRV